MPDEKIFTLKIFLQLEDLEIDLKGVRNQLIQYYQGDYNHILAEIDHQYFNEAILEIAEKTMAYNLAHEEEIDHSSGKGTVQAVNHQIKRKVENLDLLLPIFWTNIAALLAQVIEDMFDWYEKNFGALEFIRDCVERTWRFVHYYLASSLEPAIFPDKAEEFGFPAIASFMRRYQLSKDDLEAEHMDKRAATFKKVLGVKPYVEVGLDGSAEHHVGDSRAFATEFGMGFDSEDLSYHPKVSHIVDHNVWYFYFIPQIIWYYLQSTFWDGIPLARLKNKVGLKLEDYERIGYY